MSLTMTDKKKKPGPPPNPESKRSKGVSRYANPRYAFHIKKKVLDALDAYCQAQPYPPEKSHVFRKVMSDFLIAEGYLKPEDA
jgi:hypothetical protein